MHCTKLVQCLAHRAQAWIADGVRKGWRSASRCRREAGNAGPVGKTSDRDRRASRPCAGEGLLVARGGGEGWPAEELACVLAERADGRGSGPVGGGAGQ